MDTKLRKGCPYKGQIESCLLAECNHWQHRSNRCAFDEEPKAPKTPKASK